MHLQHASVTILQACICSMHASAACLVADCMCRDELAPQPSVVHVTWCKSVRCSTSKTRSSLFDVSTVPFFLMRVVRLHGRGRNATLPPITADTSLLPRCDMHQMKKKST